MTSRSSAVVASTIDHEARQAAEAAQTLLGALMLDSSVAWPLVKELVSAADFDRADHRLIFGAVSGAIADFGKADGVLVCTRLQDAGQLEAAGGVQYISSLVEDTPSAVNADAYAKIVRNFAGRNKVINLATEAAARARTGSATEAAEHLAAGAERIAREHAARVEPLFVEPAAAWASGTEPGPREWIVDGLIPARKVTSFLGNGGTGKTLAALQIGLHVSLGLPLFGFAVSGGPVLGIFCEDDEDELNRRLRAACASQRVDLADVQHFSAVSRDGLDSVLCTFERDHIRLSAFHAQLEATIAEVRPRLVILDTAADMFAGDFLSTPQVRQFLKVALGGLCVRYGCAVLLLAHPSAAGMSTGDGGGFSTAWHNSVRSRLYLSRPTVAADPTSDEPPPDLSDCRVLEAKKANYGKEGTKIALRYERGCFIVDDDPPELGPSTRRVRTTSLSLSALSIIRSTEPAVTSFRGLFDQLQNSGEIPAGDYDVRRKPLSRALKNLLADGLISETSAPRGYRPCRK